MEHLPSIIIIEAEQSDLVDDISIYLNKVQSQNLPFVVVFEPDNKIQTNFQNLNSNSKAISSSLNK